ncbi:hypothetical protein [Latilactobacillus curvatus]|uniref:hypothetical protein n=1 Tax=Latilactobacillus curvatus TaxID=28038 RepID=UPI0020A48D1A|nr:hypothetical protein [Latilactobacillus curvatus]UTC12399.1 hypothetical protein A4W75_04685 [Latilactobacillus curvatus]
MDKDLKKVIDIVLENRKSEGKASIIGTTKSMDGGPGKRNATILIDGNGNEVVELLFRICKGVLDNCSIEEKLYFLMRLAKTISRGDQDDK